MQGLLERKKSIVDMQWASSPNDIDLIRVNDNHYQINCHCQKIGDARFVQVCYSQIAKDRLIAPYVAGANGKVPELSFVWEADILGSLVPLCLKIEDVAEEVYKMVRVDEHKCDFV